MVTLDPGGLFSPKKVQKRVVKMMSDGRGESFEEKLKDAGLMLLEERRIRRGYD